MASHSVSQLSEDNEGPIPDLNELEKWLAKVEENHKKWLSRNLLNSSQGKLQGPYKKKGTVQSLQTQQHNRKKARDWTVKMQNEGYGDLRSFFQTASKTDDGATGAEIYSEADELHPVAPTYNVRCG